MPTPDPKSARRHAPATERNRQPLLEVLRPRVTGRVLEIASGTGQHARWFSEHLDVIWQPTDYESSNLPSIEAWREGGPAGLLAPVQLDVHARPWAVGPADTVVAINLVHISPWSATEALFEGARLHGADQVVTYGPYRIDGQQTAPSNEAFERWLKGRDPRFGVRDLADLERVAEANGYRLTERIGMPANNFTLFFNTP